MLFYLFILSYSQVISLENKYLTAVYDASKSGALYSKVFINKKNRPLIQSKYEDFVISFKQINQYPSLLPTPNKNKWEIISFLSENDEFSSNTPVQKTDKESEINIIIQNDRNTKNINYISMINFGQKLTFKSISFIQNQDFFSIVFGKSFDDVKLKVKKGQYDQTVYFSMKSNDKFYFNLTEAITSQYIAIITRNEIEISQFDLYGDFIPYVNNEIKSTDLKCIESTQKGNEVSFKFATYKFNDARFDITEVVELLEDEPKFEKHLVINCDKKDVKIEYISFENKRSYSKKKFNEQGIFISRKIDLKMNVEYVLDPLSLEVCRSTKETEILIRFNRPVILDGSTFSIDGLTIVAKSLWSDERTLTITTASMKDYQDYQLSIKGVKDHFDSELTTSVGFQYFPLNVVCSVYGNVQGSDSVISNVAVNTDSFTIRLNVNNFNKEKNVVLLHSKDNEISVEITNDNHIKFTVGSLSVTSKSEVSNGNIVTLVRERNSYLRIYIGNKLEIGEWDKSMKKSITLQDIILNKNGVIYNYVKIFNYGFTSKEVDITEISLKNEYIERIFTISNNKVKTTELINYRTDSVITVVPRDGSEEFLFSIPTSLETKINRDEKVYRVKNVLPTPIDRKDWKVTANSEQNTKQGTKEGPVENIIDGNINTIWHSKYNDKEGGHDERADKSDPFQVTFDLGKETDFKSFSYTPRQNGENGRINHYEVYVSNSMDELNNLIVNKNYDIKGDFQYTSTSPIYVNFSRSYKARYIALLSVNHDGYGSGADFSLYNEYAPLSYSDISSSWFDLDHYDVSQTENGQKVKFTYKPLMLLDKVQFNVTVEYELQNGKHYIEKEITIKIPKENYDDVKFDYLDLDRLVISDSDKEKSWTHPFVEPTRNDLLTKYIISLGQPVYINSFFSGCRFPFSDNQIVDNLFYNRYQAGKNYSQLRLEEDGTYRCWKTVTGASRSTNIEVIRNDFYSYINDISVENKFRKQYNSWYDWMKEITESNILSSFKEIEKGCTQMGVKPLDSYVIDDGWNNYNSEKYKVYNKAESGTTYNEVGFWTMNDKFPDGFNKPSDFAHSVSSNFGVWLGPRGGYGYNSAMGHMVEDAGNGYYNAQNSDIDVASAKYTFKLRDFFNAWIKEYKVNYYKLDGWLLKPCHNDQHDHVVGGYDYVYEYSDYWERYIDVFKSMRETAEQNGVHDMWISLTCYINPSPFHLQWANSIWVQISNDVGYTKITNKDTYADQMLNYRDNVYYDFYQKYQFQLPQQSIYNHDPIYGKTGTPLSGSLNDDEFRKYLLMCGMRGTSFFELYYTYGMIDEGDKWFINSEVLNYIEKRHDVLKNSQIFGGAPGTGNVYGYSAWNEEKGTIAIRNPSNEVKQYTIKLNREIGVPENIQTTYRKIVLNFNTIEDLSEGKEQNYGDEIGVTLQPLEVRIIDFEPSKDTKCAEIENVKAVNDKEIQIRFNKKIRFDLNNYQLNNDAKIDSGKLRGDLRTVSLYLLESLVNDTDYEITLSDVTDSIGNVLNTKVIYPYMANNLIVSIQNQIGPIDDEKLILSSKKNVVDSFTIHLDVNRRDDKNEVLIQDVENKVFVEIVNKHIRFSVDSISVESKEEIPLDQNIKITCVRERNTMVKIYINGELSKSNYAENQNDRLSLEKIQLCHSSLVYNSIFIASYGYSYKEVLDIKE